MNFALLNIGVWLFSLMAIIIPVINLIKQDRGCIDNLGLFSVLSISSCAISLCMLIIYGNDLVDTKNFIILTNISGTVKHIAVVLVVTTAVLNLITYMVQKEKKFDQ